MEKEGVMHTEHTWVDWTDEYPYDTLTNSQRDAIYFNPNGCAASASSNGNGHKSQVKDLIQAAILQSRRRQTASSSGTDNIHNTKEAFMPAVRTSRKPAAKKSSAKVSKSYAVEMDRFADPKGSGGVRFQTEDKDNVVTNVYARQAEAGKHQRCTVTIEFHD
jgi:hypothetical protein